MTTHWKKLTNPDYLGAYSLQPKEERIIEIESVSNEIVKGADGKSQDCIVAKIKGEKPMILNKTNCKSIAKIHDTPFIEDWAGKKITIHAVKVRAFGDIVDALRVKPELPKLPELTPNHPNWGKAKEAIQSGDVKIEQIRTKYELSKENELKLISNAS